MLALLPGAWALVDDIEQLAIDRARQLFGAEHANVQPYSGSPANMAVYFALLEPGDTVLGMQLSEGGHLTHGSPVSFSGKFYNFVHYGVDPRTELIDYDHVAALARQHQPKLIVAGASAYPRIIDWQRFKEIADSVGARLLADMAHIARALAAAGRPSQPGALRGRVSPDHDAQEPQGSAGGHDSVQAGSGEGD